MLNMLRADLEHESTMNAIEESAVNAVDSEIRDTILDDLGEDDLNIEDDKELSNFVNKIPEYDEEKEMNKKLKRLAESFIPDYDL